MPLFLFSKCSSQKVRTVRTRSPSRSNSQSELFGLPVRTVRTFRHFILNYPKSGSKITNYSAKIAIFVVYFK